MESGVKKNVAIGLAAVGLIALVVVFWRTREGENTPNAPDGTFWICSNDQCKHEFNLSVADLADHHEKHYGEPVPCPKCKKPAVRAEQCPHCKKILATGRGVVKCPSCGKALYEAPAGGG